MHDAIHPGRLCGVEGGTEAGDQCDETGIECRPTDLLARVDTRSGVGSGVDEHHVRGAAKRGDEALPAGGCVLGNVEPAVLQCLAQCLTDDAVPGDDDDTARTGIGC